MTTWLHFVGQAYYKTSHRFVVEAVRYGITRRVALATLRKMEWGDRVLLAQRDGSSTVVFGQFTIEKLSGLSAEAGAAVREALGDRLDYTPFDVPQRVERGCGTYTVTGVFSVRETTLAQLVAAVEKAKDPGKLMVGGHYSPLFVEGGAWSSQVVNGHGVAALPVDRVRLKSVPHAQGFRPFAYDEWRSEVVSAIHARPGKPVVLRGHFYGKTDHERAVDAGLAELVDDYRRGSRWEQGGLEI